MLYICREQKNIMTTQIGTFTKININKGAIISQTTLFLDCNNEIVKGDDVCYTQIDNRKKLIEFISTLEQCRIEFNNTKRVYKTFDKFFVDNNIDFKIESKDFPFEDEGDSEYMELEGEFFN